MERAALRTLQRFNAQGDARDVVLNNQLAPEDMEAVVSSYSNLEVRFTRGDFTREEILDRARIRHAAQAILLPDRSDPTTTSSPDHRTILAGHIIRSTNPEIQVFAHILDEEHAMDLKRPEVDGVMIGDCYA
ncbi:MAG TPA: hypothetical protein DIU35_13060 [Candidatus Latescibacteria bacterium]|nr:hypothetical protein [Candidatus Latescibacterota bacterium]